jgi:hypothetical protein
MKHFGVKSDIQDFRKYSSFFKKAADPNPNLTLPLLTWSDKLILELMISEGRK